MEMTKFELEFLLHQKKVSRMICKNLNVTISELQQQRSEGC